MEGGVHGGRLGGVVVSSPSHDKGEEGRARHHQLHHKGERRFAVPARGSRQDFDHHIAEQDMALDANNAHPMAKLMSAALKGTRTCH